MLLAVGRTLQRLIVEQEVYHVLHCLRLHHFALQPPGVPLGGQLGVSPDHFLGLAEGPVLPPGVCRPVDAPLVEPDYFVRLLVSGAGLPPDLITADGDLHRVDSGLETGLGWLDQNRFNASANYASAHWRPKCRMKEPALLPPFRSS